MEDKIKQAIDNHFNNAITKLNDYSLSLDCRITILGLKAFSKEKLLYLHYGRVRNTNVLESDK